MTCVWDADFGPRQAEWDALPEDVRERALLLATSTLQALTNYRVGTCPETIRPCPDRPRCGCRISGLRYEGGVWRNGCGCRSVCRPLYEYALPGPVGYIERFMVNGEEITLPSPDWRLDEGHILVWQGHGPSPIPAVQDLSLPDTEPGTWSITYSRSYPLGQDGRIAVGALALEFANAIRPRGKCALPRGVTRVVRNNVAMEVDVGLFLNGLTNIEVVDAFILKWAPAGSPTQAAYVFDPRLVGRRRG